MFTDLDAYLTSMGQGHHTCLVYETAEQQLAAAVPFVRQGLAHDERCLYIVDDVGLDASTSCVRSGGAPSSSSPSVTRTCGTGTSIRTA